MDIFKIFKNSLRFLEIRDKNLSDAIFILCSLERH